MQRMVFLDNLKLHVIVLVIIHHVLVAYGASGSWPLIEKVTDVISPQIFSMITAINQSFFMNLLMLLSGFFVAGSLTRKGKAKYIKDRLIRLGIPLALYPFISGPIIHFIVLRFGRGQHVTFFETFHVTWDVGPLWFIEALLLFTTVYVVIKGGKYIEVFKDSFPTSKYIYGTIVVLATLTYCVRIFSPIDTWMYHFMPGHFVVYIFMFSIGIIASQNKWFEHLNTLKHWRFAWVWGVLGFNLVAGTLVYGFSSEISQLLGGGSWQSFVFALWDTSSAFAIIISLLYLYSRRMDTQGPIAKWMSPNFYGAYIFHNVVIILCMVPYLNSSLPSPLKALIVAAMSIPSSFLVTWVIRQIPSTKHVLG